MAYTTIKKPSDYFNTVLYTGTGSELAITGVGFQPDWTWIKRRDAVAHGGMFDNVRGVTKLLSSSQTDAEQTIAQSLKSFDSDGFTLGTGTNGYVNTSGSTTVAWNWLASNTTASNTDGSITSTVSANTTSGFSIVTWTGSASASNQTVGHGLGVAPSMVILKNKSVVDNWFVYHSGATANNQYLNLNSTSAVTTAGSNTWGAGMTSTLVGLRPGTFCGSTSDNVIMYCFAEKKGFSKFGSYTGNGSTDGTFVYTGFKPAFVIQKNTSVAQGWQLQDNKRLGYNPDNYLLQPHTSQSESALQRVDLLSNGFKVRTTDAGQNASGNNYIYMAFAENPFVTSTGIPATAR